MKITVVVPCRNEVNYIKECIEAIYKSDLPEDCEVSTFIVDGKSDDGTVEVIQELSKTYKGLHIVTNEKQLTPYAFNLGIKAGGVVDFVQIVGARHIISRNYLIRCINKIQEDKSVWCVGGRILNEFINESGETISKAMGTTFGMGIGNFRTLDKSCFTDTVTSPMYPYWVFEKIGFFDEELIRNQDDDFNYRVSKAGGKIYYDHEISLRYYVRGSIKGLRRQFFQYGYWKVYVNKKHSAVTTIRQLVPPLFVAYLLITPISWMLGMHFAAIWNIPILLYVIMNTVFSMNAAKSVNEVPKLMLTYLILHVSYGFGYLNGIVEFILLGKKPSNNQKRLSR